MTLPVGNTLISNQWHREEEHHSRNKSQERGQKLPVSPTKMKILFVEPAIFLNAFAMSLTSPLTTQYVYRRIWEETGNYSFTSNSNVSECEKNKSSPLFEFQEEVQKKVSLFSLQMEISGLVPGLVSTFILLSNSDLRGRKLPMALSSVGALATSIWLCLLSYFALPIQLLIASAFLSALCGNYTTFWGACLAYVVDQCKDHKQKIIRIAILDFIFGLVNGLTGLSSGYFIRELGFMWSFVVVAATLAVNLIYILFFLHYPVKETSPETVTMSWCEGFKNLFYRTCELFKNISGKRRTTLCLLIFTMITYFFMVAGISPIFILYELNSPLCWNEVFIGYGSALGSVSFLSSFVGIWLFSYCMEDTYITLIGILTTMVGMALTAFAKTTLLMFLVRIPFMFTMMPLSVLRAMLSKVVHSAEQGTLFACLAFLETLAGVIAGSTFNGIYSATVAWFPGFPFLLSAVLLLIPLVSLSAVKCINWNEGNYRILLQEESHEDTSG